MSCVQVDCDSESETRVAGDSYYDASVKLSRSVFHVCRRCCCSGRPWPERCTIVTVTAQVHFKNHHHSDPSLRLSPCRQSHFEVATVGAAAAEHCHPRVTESGGKRCNLATSRPSLSQERLVTVTSQPTVTQLKSQASSCSKY